MQCPSFIFFLNLLWSGYHLSQNYFLLLFTDIMVPLEGLVPGQ